MAPPSTQRSPPLFQRRIAVTRPSSTRTPVAQVWRRSSTPASSARRSQRSLSASWSYVTPVPAPYVFGRSKATPSSRNRPTTSQPSPPTTRRGDAPGV